MRNVVRSERINRSAGLALIAGLALGACGDGNDALPQLSKPTTETSALPELTTTSEVESTLPELPTTTPNEIPALPDLSNGEAQEEPFEADDSPYEAILESRALQPLSVALGNLLDSGQAGITRRSVDAEGYGYYEIIRENSDGQVIFFNLEAPSSDDRPDLESIRHISVQLTEKTSSPSEQISTNLELSRIDTDGSGNKPLHAFGSLNGTIFTTQDDMFGETDVLVVTDPLEAAELAAETAAVILAALEK